MLKKLFRDRKGQGLVEYALLIAGVSVISAAGVTMFGHKTGDLINTVAAILPGAHTDDNGPIVSGHLLETTAATATQGISLDLTQMGAAAVGVDRLNGNLFGGTTYGTTDSTLVLESDTQ